MSPAASGRRVLGAVVAGAVTVLASRTLRSVPPGGPERWTRTNHAGRPVTLLEGPELVVGAGVGALVSGSPAGAVAAVGAGVFGLLDDLVGDSSSKGLRGHLGALARGRITTGAVKILGLGVTGVVAAALADRTAADRTAADPPPGSRLRLAGEAALGGALVAATANLVNLLDLRPGRALKATLLLGGPLALTGSAAAPAAIGAAVAALPDDLAGRSMLGDTGANAAGALLGVALLERLGRRGRLGALALLTALTFASERVSFTAVIESTPGLRELDAWGRPTATASSEPTDEVTE